jgi:hypothetical protein
LFKKAAEQGHVGMPNLANSYARGDGVEKDWAASLDWNTRAANAGNAQPMFNLGNMYFLGRGVPKRTRTAHQIGCERQQRWATLMQKRSSALICWWCVVGRVGVAMVGVLIALIVMMIKRTRQITKENHTLLSVRVLRLSLNASQRR